MLTNRMVDSGLLERVYPHGLVASDFRVHVSCLSRVQTSDEIGQIRHQHPQPAFESEGLTLRAGFTSYARHWQPLPYERATGDEQVQGSHEVKSVVCS